MRPSLRNRQTDTAAKLPLPLHRANYQYIVEAKLTLVVDFAKNNIGPLVMYDLILSGWHQEIRTINLSKSALAMGDVMLNAFYVVGLNRVYVLR